MDIAKLKDELTTDPLARGYSGMDERQVVTSINTVNRDVNITSLTGDQIFAATDGAEFAALTTAKQQLWLAFCGRDGIDPFGTANVAFVTWVFGGGSTTISNLQPLRKQTVSRAGELGLGQVYPGHVEQARA